MEAFTIYHLTRSSDNTLYFLQVIAATRFDRNIQPAKCAVVASRGQPEGYDFERAIEG
jgi:hypothetical protein